MENFNKLMFETIRDSEEGSWRKRLSDDLLVYSKIGIAKRVGKRMILLSLIPRSCWVKKQDRLFKPLASNDYTSNLGENIRKWRITLFFLIGFMRQSSVFWFHPRRTGVHHATDGYFMQHSIQILEH